MAEHWGLVATKGCVGLTVMTFRRAWQEGIFLLDCHFLLRTLPDGAEEPIDARCPTAELVREYIVYMEPHSYQLLVADDEDVEAVQAQIDGKLQ